MITSNQKKLVQAKPKFGLDEDRMTLKLDLVLQKKLFLKKDFNLTVCAREMDVPAHHLSYFIKNHFGLSFPLYKNILRMEYAKGLITKGYLVNNRVEELAVECGFANRTSFSKAFKKVTSISPSEYVSQNANKV